MPMDNPDFKSVVFRYFRGQLTDNEYELLAVFLQDKTNREFFEKQKTEWEGNPELDGLGFSNLSRLQYKLSQGASSRILVNSPRHLWIKIASVAAILILGLFAGSLSTFLFSPSLKTSEQLVFETPRGEKSMVRLPDGTEVWLNANSRLVYNSFSPEHRQVELKGEAFFKVVRNEKAPFVVKTNECDVKVLGTTFNVMAYDEFGRKEITLLSGKVDVYAGNITQELKPGQALILKNKKIQVVDNRSVDASGWVENKFNFQNIPLSELMQRLENWYDVDITLVNHTGKEVNFTGTFKNEETIWQVLDAIKVYTPIQYTKTELRKINIEVNNNGTK